MKPQWKEENRWPTWQEVSKFSLVVTSYLAQLESFLERRLIRTSSRKL